MRAVAITCLPSGSWTGTVCGASHSPKRSSTASGDLRIPEQRSRDVAKWRHAVDLQKKVMGRHWRRTVGHPCVRAEALRTAAPTGDGRESSAGRSDWTRHMTRTETPRNLSASRRGNSGKASIRLRGK